MKDDDRKEKAIFFNLYDCIDQNRDQDCDVTVTDISVRAVLDSFAIGK